ncbi:unnamed protein product [Rangifer tarandus platyrhynchus]|uniref:Uncharacterized protein n=2 Tax=Rangifer tarandus platyrhynchus TaxID=3082113 RepID=A0ACB0FBH7_RANTA|nr:unnamed protein product [Rangifer tarandus platyrhynchus]CAI9710299.1 unnamed protein product [Rangifer tarandus platyrhynchus]
MIMKTTARYQLIPNRCTSGSRRRPRLQQDHRPQQLLTSESERLPRRTTIPGMHCSAPNPCRKARPRKEAAASPGPRVPMFSFRQRASPQPRTEHFRGPETAARAKAPPPLQESPGQRSHTNFLSGFGARRAVSDGMRGVGVPAGEDPAAAPEAPRLGRQWWRSP